jgi:hypothetical protein
MEASPSSDRQVPIPIIRRIFEGEIDGFIGHQAGVGVEIFFSSS